MEKELDSSVSEKKVILFLHDVLYFRPFTSRLLYSVASTFLSVVVLYSSREDCCIIKYLFQV